MASVIDLSSSPEPGPSRSQTRSQAQQKVKATAQRQRTRVGTVIELTDSESDSENRPAIKRRALLSRNATPVESSRSRGTPSFTHLQPMAGGSGSLQNIPSQSRRTKTPTAKNVPLFLPSDEENEPPLRAQPAIDNTPIDVDIALDNGPVPLQIAQHEPMVVDPPLEPQPEEDPLSLYTARVLEIVPDVEPDHLLALVTKFAPSLEDGVVEHVLHALFEDGNYPKVDKKGKGKRKETDDAKGGGIAVEMPPSKKSKIDYADQTREFKGGKHYTDLALVSIPTILNQ